MQRIYGAFAYGSGPRDGCWWDDTVDLPVRASLAQDLDVDVAIIGGGFTGLSAALALAEKGVRTAVFEAEHLGWGASGRNGGFCCLGGAKADDAELDKKYGKDARLEFRDAELKAVRFVENLIERFEIDVDRHSRGETELAHRQSDMERLRRAASMVQENYGVEPQIIEKHELAEAGMNAQGFHGALTTPVGFGLNPRKYLAGLACAAEDAGALLFERSPVTSLARRDERWHMQAGKSRVKAEQVIVATNGYSSEDVPDWLRARYLPTQSNVLVTRPLSRAELDDQGWFTDQMSFDTRNMVHYFRLMPDRRFLFGMRGTILSNPAAERRARAATRRHFEKMFPAWSDVETTHSWSGMVSLAFNKVPYVGTVPEHTGMLAAMCYHGNGVAMGSYCGNLAATLAANGDVSRRAKIMGTHVRRFPLGALRRLLVPPLYAGLMWQDL